MGWVAAVGAVLSVVAQQSASNAEQAQLDLQKRQEKGAAADREVQRQRRLNAILGSQNAAIAASGVVNQGSIANVSLVDAKRAAEDSNVDRINTSSRIIALSEKSRSIKRVANIQSAATIFQAAGRAYDRGSLPGQGAGRPTPSQATEAGSGIQPSLQRYA